MGSLWRRGEGRTDWTCSQHWMLPVEHELPVSPRATMGAAAEGAVSELGAAAARRERERRK